MTHTVRGKKETTETPEHAENDRKSFSSKNKVTATTASEMKDIEKKNAKYVCSEYFECCCQFDRFE